MLISCCSTDQDGVINEFNRQKYLYYLDDKNVLLSNQWLYKQIQPSCRLFHINEDHIGETFNHKRAKYRYI